MKLYIIRHGETDLNAQGAMQGRLDAPLNRAGRELAALSGQGMRGIRFDRCISSPLSRARETAEIVLRESGQSLPIEFDERLREIDFGDLEGRSLSGMGAEFYSFFLDPFHFAGFPNGEGIPELCERTQAFLRELLAQDDGTVCLVSTHGCAMRAMVNYLKEDPSDFWYGHAPYNCSVTLVETENGRPRITAVDRVYYDESLIQDHFSR